MMKSNGLTPYSAKTFGTIFTALVILTALTLISGCMHTPKIKQLAMPESNSIHQIEQIYTSAGSRTQKITALLTIVENAQQEAVKITALQALADLEPIEYADTLIVLANSADESLKVRATAINTLNEAYIIDDNLVAKIGGSTVYNQSNKISAYMTSLINNAATPQALRDAALQGYPYTNADKAVVLAITMIEKNQPVKAADANFIASTMIANDENMERLLPILEQNQQSLTDDLVTSLATFAADPVVRADMSLPTRQRLVALLKSHTLDSSNPMYDIEQEVLSGYLLSLDTKQPANLTDNTSAHHSDNHSVNDNVAKAAAPFFTYPYTHGPEIQPAMTGTLIRQEGCLLLKRGDKLSVPVFPHGITSWDEQKQLLTVNGVQIPLNSTLFTNGPLGSYQYNDDFNYQFAQEGDKKCLQDRTVLILGSQFGDSKQFLNSR